MIKASEVNQRRKALQKTDMGDITLTPPLTFLSSIPLCQLPRHVEGSRSTADALLLFMARWGTCPEPLPASLPPLMISEVPFVSHP